MTLNYWPSPHVMQARNFAVRYPEVYAELQRAAEVNHADLDEYVLYACEKKSGTYGFSAAFYPLVTAEEYQRQREANRETTWVSVPEYLWFAIEGDVGTDGTLERFEIFAVYDGGGESPDGNQ